MGKLGYGKIQKRIPFIASAISWAIFVPVSITPNNILYKHGIDLLYVIMLCMAISFFGSIFCFTQKNSTIRFRLVSSLATLSFPLALVFILALLYIATIFGGLTV